MSMTIILAPNYAAGNAYAQEHGFTLRDSRVITLSGDHCRGLRATDLHIVGAPKFNPGALDCLALAFIHSDEAYAAWKDGMAELANRLGRRSVEDFLNL